MSQQIVEQVKSELEARGFRWETNCDAFQITARVAWRLKDQGAQLVGKRPEQNHCEWRGVRYAVDVIAFPSGWIDCLGAAGPPANANIPVWNPTNVSPDAPLYAPINLDPVDVPPADPPPVDHPPVGGNPIGLVALELIQLANLVDDVATSIRKINDLLVKATATAT